MTDWLDRYNTSFIPTKGQAARDIVVRALLPMLVLLALNYGVGYGIVHSWEGWHFEDAVNAALQSGRTPDLDTAARVASAIGSAPGNIGACIVFMALVFWRTKRWWVALLPGLALSLEAIVHAVTSVVVNRTRPQVEHLDAAQPTASFPSGHVGASLAQILILFFLAAALQSVLARSAVVLVGVGFVMLLAFSRLYLGMHHVSDVVVGLLNGIVCACLAWGYLKIRDGDAAASDSPRA